MVSDGKQGGLLDIAKGLYGVGKGVVQGFLRGTAAAGGALAGLPQEISDVAQGKPAQIGSFPLPSEDTPYGTFLRSFYGTEPGQKDISFGSVGAEYPFVQKGSAAAPLVGALGSVLDLTGAGEGAKGLIGLTKTLKATTDVAEAERLLKGAGFAADLASQAAPKFAALTDAKQIEEGLLKLQDLQNTTRTGSTAARVAQTAADNASAVERGFATSVKEAVPELVSRVGGQYIPRSTDTLAIKAKNFIADNIDAAVHLARTGTDDKAVATASELIKKFSTDAAAATDPALRNILYDKAAIVANDAARNLTELGRSVQAASILGRLTSEGQVRFAAREIQKFNEAVDTSTGGTLGLTKKIPELSAEQAQHITEQMNAIKAMSDGTEKAIAFKRLQDYISSLVPTPLYKKIIAVWKAGLLTGIKTSGLNTFSNLFHGVSEAVKDIPAAAVDTVASLFTGKRTLALTARGTLAGGKEGFSKGWRYLKTGYDERDIAGKLDFKNISFGKSKFARAIQAYEEGIFRVLGAEDQPFYYGAKARSLASQAIAIAKNTTSDATSLSKSLGSKALSPELKNVEDQAFMQIAHQGEANMVKDYIDRFGNTVNTDNARELFPQYATDKSLSAGVHEPASYISKKVYEFLLEKNKKVGDGTVVFTGGGTGAGKTSALADIPVLSSVEKKASLVYDTNSNKVESAVGKIEQALKAGYDVNIIYVYRDPVEAFANGTLPRAESMGRTVPIAEHVATHMGIPDTALAVIEKYKDDPRVKVQLVDNSLGKGKSAVVDDPVAFLKEKGYTKADEQRITEKLNGILERAKEAGTIKPGTYNGTKGLGITTNGEGHVGQLKPQSAREGFVNNLIAHPTDEMLRNATVDAETAVFQNSTVLGKIARKIQDAPGGEIIVPFGKTPAAVATQLINYSPVGFIKTMAENIGKGKFDQRAFSQGFGRAAVGTGVMYLGSKLYDQGMIALGTPTSEIEQKQWQLEGKKANSILIDGKWRGANVLGPAGMALLVGGYFQQGLKQTGSVFGGLAQAAAGAGQSLTQQTFLQGINSLTNAITDPQRSATSFFSGLIGSVIPTIVSDVSRGTDTVERRTPGFTGTLQSRIPGAREKLEPQVDTFGQPVKTPDFLTTMLDPTRPSTAKSDPVVSELKRLSAAGYKATPTQLGDKNGFGSLTPEQNTQLWERSGTLLKGKLDKLIALPEYQKADDEKKYKIFLDFADKAKLQARVEMLLEVTQGLDGDALKAELSRQKAGGLMTKEVFDQFAQIR